MKNNNKSLKFKILLSLITLIMLSVVTYISLPYISYAIESANNNFLENVSAITSPENSEEVKNQIHEHRGHTIWWNKSYDPDERHIEQKTYEEADGEDEKGIQDIDSFVKTYLSPNIGVYSGGGWTPGYGWLNALIHNTSIFCRENGVKFPSYSNRLLGLFHESKDTNDIKEVNTKVYDYIEWVPKLACETKISVMREVKEEGDGAEDDSVEIKTVQVTEATMWGDGASKSSTTLVESSQSTYVRVKYTPYPRDFDTIESYIFTYSLRNHYYFNPAQSAIWYYRNNKSGGKVKEQGQKLLNAAKAINELKDPVKPTMTKTTDDTDVQTTGTVIDGTNFKIGPIYMNQYSYGWSEAVKEFSGECSIKNEANADILSNKNDAQKEFFKGLVAGIIEAKVTLDNDKEFILNKENFTYSQEGSTATGSEYLSYPTAAEGYEYPLPDSKFYILLPISECENASSVANITMTYKWHTADGNGGDLKGTYDKLSWKNSATAELSTDTTYKCDHSYDGYACTNDELAANNRSADYDEVNKKAHDFWCEKDGWCQYGSSATSTVVADDTSGTTRFTDKITASCTSTWGCGKSYHKHGNTWDNGTDGHDHVNDSSNVLYYCSCSHTHVSGCFKTNCGYSNGDLICDTTEHSHSSGRNANCNTKCSHKNCTTTKCTVNSSGNTVVGCVHGHTTSCCDKAHTHTRDAGCYHYHSGSSSAGTGCYGTQVCPHYPGESTCANLNGCCSYTEHTHEIDKCGKTHGCSKNYCIHGFADGKHTCDHGDGYTGHTGDKCTGNDWGDTHLGNCYGPKGTGTVCNKHGIHRNCMKYYWELIKPPETFNCQQLMYVSDAQVYEHSTECSIENIALVAKVEIDKYIYDVKHVKTATGAADDTFGPSDERRDLDEDTKESNPVYVESDDEVTYKIIMKNSSAFGVKIRVDDILPDANAYKFISADLGEVKIEDDIKKLREQVIVINAESEASIKVTLQVKTLEGIHENRGRIITRNGSPKNDDDDVDYIRTVEDNAPVVNHIGTECDGTTKTLEWESSDWFILNNYNVFIDKYVYKYDEEKQKDNNNTLFITNEDSIVDENNVLKESRVNTKTTTEKVSDGNLEDTIRVNKIVKDANGKDIAEHELYKSEHPVNVEKEETVTYAIRVYNDATLVKNTQSSGNKTPTKLYVTSIEDKLHYGLNCTSVSATIFYKDGTVKVPEVLGVTYSDNPERVGDYNIYTITASSAPILEPGEYIEFYMAVEVVQSNMYLFEMNNEAKIKKISNINDIDVTERNISKQEETTEYIRMKDLVISGKVWLDFDKDGIMNDKPRDDFEDTNYSVNEEAMKEGVAVRLYRVEGDENTGELIRTTKTDANGLYTFARAEGEESWYDTFNNTKDYSADTTYQRIDKASGKDANGNYTTDSQYYRYYIEFAYDGVIYKSTEVYAGMDNLNNDGSLKKYSGEIEPRYKSDSNATEFDKDREGFNERYEYISYNTAYDMNKENNKTLEFEKQEHVSYLKEDSSREMTAKSFVINTDDTQKIKYLWLYPYNENIDNKIPETEYLKYINLGLELREDVDLAVSKDVYSVTTTINGEEMEYMFNKGDTDEYRFDKEKSNTPYNTVRKPYGFEIYESDYKYRVEQYLSEVVEKYKGLEPENPDQKFGTDELTIEVTYRINLQNKITKDDAYLEESSDTKETELTAKVHEVLDLYDENFLDLSEGPTIPVMVKNGDKLDPINKAVVEAWTYNGTTKVPLEVKTTSDFVTRDMDVAKDGYKRLYISGMDGIEIAEGDDFDIYVKYVVDKDELTIEMDEEAKLVYEDTQTTTTTIYDSTTETVEVTDVQDPNVSAVISNVTTEKERTLITGEKVAYFEATMRRSLKLAEKTNNGFKEAEKGGRGTENIAQINAYSIWYGNGKPASLVDKDSNAGNIGIGATSVDDTRYYEDMVYKTGIELISEGSENSKYKLTEKYNDEWEKEHGEIEIIATSEPVRKIQGTVWDDARSNVITEKTSYSSIFDVYDAQFVGNGKYNSSDKAYTENNKIIPKLNESIPVLYGDASKTEEKDMPVRGVKAEYIEIVTIEKDDGEKVYYEEVLSSVSWGQKQSARTGNDGEYELSGFKPGNYIVRFTYGDTVDSNSYGGPITDTAKIEQVKKDMQIFNGQDYKSAKYNGVLDSETGVDEIIKGFEIPGESDARDDEVRRLEINSYSEIMTNEKAEILKGLANGRAELAPTSKANSSIELKELTDNTYMTADTREFSVKAEKLTTTQTAAYTSEDIFYELLEKMMNEHINNREFVIKNVDFGIEYRPESQISLMKEIVQLTLITENNETIVDLYFDTKKDPTNEKIIIHEINKEKSIGYELVQFITNNYIEKPLINNLISEEYVQGLVYVQVDEEILQGCTVKITYGFNAQNCSEVDRISKKLNAIRYRDNKATDNLIKSYKEKYAVTKPEVLIGIDNIIEGRYTASAMAKAAVFADTYDYDIDDGSLVYRVIPKTLTTDGENGYYGRYVGYGYHTGEMSDLDEIARLKFDKILDYIDTNLEYEPKTTTSEEITNKLWSKITSRELIDLVSHYKDLRATVSSMTDEELPRVTNIDGIEYKSMVVSVDDRNVDIGDPNESEIKKEAIKNKDLSRFLIPKVTAVGLNGNDEKGKENDEKDKLGYDDYTGHIYLDVSKVLAAGSSDDDKTYENMAEVVQFTTLTGRRTNFATTIGNANIHDIKESLDAKRPPFEDTDGDNPGSIEFITSSVEPDTSATETITLIPPTGLMKNRRAIVSIMEKAKVGVEVMSMTGLVVAIVVGTAFLVILVMKKYKKRRIK